MIVGLTSIRGHVAIKEATSLDMRIRNFELEKEARKELAEFECRRETITDRPESVWLRPSNSLSCDYYGKEGKGNYPDNTQYTRTDIYNSLKKELDQLKQLNKDMCRAIRMPELFNTMDEVECINKLKEYEYLYKNYQATRDYKKNDK